MSTNAEIKKILCVTDLSDFSNAAVPVAAILAEKLGSELFLGHVVEQAALLHGESISHSPVPPPEILEMVQSRLETMMSRHARDWIPLIAGGGVVHEIGRMIRENGVDLLVLATHGRSGVKRLVLGSVAEKLIRTLSGPVLVVPSGDFDGEGAERKPRGFERILVGCDFSEESDMALGYGLLLAGAFQSELHLVHVLEPSHRQNLMVTALEIEEGIWEKKRQALNQELSWKVPAEFHDWCIRKLKDLVPEGRCQPRTAVLEGHPYQSLVDYADSNRIDLIVLGSRGHGLAKTLFLGSTPDRVIRLARYPVLSVCPTCAA
jgi:nucleotide-binding universal stress UspA family protein